jgi:hypothetical protein
MLVERKRTAHLIHSRANLSAPSGYQSQHHVSSAIINGIRQKISRQAPESLKKKLSIPGWMPETYPIHQLDAELSCGII